MARGPHAGLLVVAALLATGCFRDVPRDESAGAPDAAAAAAVVDDDSSVAAMPVGLNQVAALALDGERVWLATSSGIVVLNPRSRSAIVLAGDDRISNANATDIAISPDGVTWTSHGTSSRPGPKQGGIRAFGKGGSVTAYFSEDGLGTDDIDSIAAGQDLVAAAAGPALAILRQGAQPARFETRLTESPRRLQVIDLTAGSAPRKVVEFRPRSERMTAVAMDGNAIVVGSTDALYRIDGEEILRFVPACRVSGAMPSHVVALAALPGGFVASLGIPGAEGEPPKPAGLAEVRDFGRLARCHAPGLDVPAATTLDVAVDGNLIWLATYEGVVRIAGDDPELLARGVEIPEAAVTAVAGDGRGGVWAGTWGGGCWHLADGLIESFTIGPDGRVQVDARRADGT